jgi:hypothetical protein
MSASNSTTVASRTCFRACIILAKERRDVPNKKIDLIGKRFGRLLVIAYAGGRKWSCVCDCDARSIIDARSLRRGDTKSCGCLRRDRLTKHGMCGTPEYQSWRGMRKRCFDPGQVYYKDYGGRGITICEEWLSFEGFFADMGERPTGCSLDRIDPNGNYEPSNCRWATDYQQATENRRPRARAAVKRRPLVEDPPF